MKKLYDEIIELKNYNKYDIDYDKGFDDGLEAAAELAKKYDTEIERLRGDNKTYKDFLNSVISKK